LQLKASYESSPHCTDTRLTHVCAYANMYVRACVHGCMWAYHMRTYVILKNNLAAQFAEQKFLAA